MTLRSELLELMLSLDELLRNVEMNEEQREQFLRRRALLSAKLDEVLRRKIDKKTDVYKAAVEQTNAAVKLAQRALRESEEREAVILEITRAAKAIDAVINSPSSCRMAVLPSSLFSPSVIPDPDRGSSVLVFCIRSRAIPGQSPGHASWRVLLTIPG